MESHAGTTPLAEIQNLVISYSSPKGDLRAVDGVSLTINRGEVLGLVGESGCGKSTLALSLLKILPPPGRIVGGTIKIDSVDIDSLTKEELRRFRWKKLAMVFQSAMNCLDPVKTIQSQIVETIREHQATTRKDEAKREVASLLELVSLDPSLGKAYPHELSGGMRQRAVIAMALCLKPELLIADEPSTALDVVVQADILRTLKDLQRKLGLTVVLISHDISIMGAMSDRLAVMYAGKVVEIGGTKEVISRPQHPYTEALLNTVPVLGRTQQKIVGIPGAPPSLYSPPSGCRFHPRCSYAFEKCKAQEPPLVNMDRERVACWLRGA